MVGGKRKGRQKDSYSTCDEAGKINYFPQPSIHYSDPKISCEMKGRGSESNNPTNKKGSPQPQQIRLVILCTHIPSFNLVS